MKDFFTIKINTKDLAFFKSFPAKAKSLHKPMKQFLAFLELETKQQFIRQVDPDGKPWADLKPATWAKKRSKTILREDSIMINTIYTKLNGVNGEIGLTSEIAIYHQEGTDKMAQRQILGITDERLEKGNSFFEVYITDLIGG
jgi:hypothetical protein